MIYFIYTVLAVSKILIAPTISNLHNCGTERDTSKKLKSDWQISRRSSDFIGCISDASLSISKLWFENIEAINSFETDSTVEDVNDFLFL